MSAEHCTMSDCEKLSIENAWKQPYRGDVHTDLKEHLDRYIQNASWPNVHSFDIVQSAWTGKSRMLDELAKECLVIPISLGSGNGAPNSVTAPYPPIDLGILEHLLQEGADDLNSVMRRCGNFIEALMNHMRVVLYRDFTEEMAGNELSRLVRSFREKMQEGMCWGKHGAYRTTFYEEVLAINARSSWRSGQYNSWYLVDACDELLRCLCKMKRYEEPPCSGRLSTLHLLDEHKPLIVVAFDNAESLIDGTMPLNSIEQCGPSQCNLAAELKRAFTWFPSHFPVLGLFMSRSPLLLSGTMQRVSSRCRVVEPLSEWMELKLDLAARKLSVAHGFTLTDVTSDEYICHLGRIGFASLWDSAIGKWRQSVIRCAAQELLHTHHLEQAVLSSVQMFACISQRLALTFDDRLSAEQLARMRLVQDHLRLCIFTKIDPELTALRAHSHSGSEPLLAEAAYFAMSQSAVDMTSALKASLVDLPVNATDGAQLVMCLLLILARDAAVGEPDDFGHPAPGRHGRSGRIMDALVFFRALFIFMDDHSVTHDSQYRDREILEGQCDTIKQLEEHLSAFQMYFNHFIPVLPQVLRIDYLTALLARGAAARCRKHGYPIDAILTMVRDGRVEQGSVALVLLRVVQHGDEGHDESDMFSAMDPYSLDILATDLPPVEPLVRIVFALDWPKGTGSYRITRRKNVDAQQRTFISYDIWITGLAPTVLCPMTPSREQEMREVLLLTRAHNTRLSLRHDRGQYVTVGMNSFSLRVGADVRPIHWNGWTRDDWSK